LLPERVAARDPERRKREVQILLTAIGSYGDVHPMVGLGRRLRERGHRVTIAVCPYFAELVERAGLEMLPLGTVEEYVEIVNNPDLWHPTRGLRTIARGILASTMRRTHRLIVERYEPGETMVVAASLDLGARIAQDQLGVPTATVHLAPALFRSLDLSPVLPPMWFGPGAPRWLKRVQYGLADRLLVDPLVAPGVNAFRAELGLPPVRQIFNQWWHSPARVIAMFPEWFAPRQRDWPSQVTLTDFPLWDESELADPPADAAEFLADGAPPIVFTPGSAMAHGRAFFRAAAEACARLGARGMLLTRYAEQVPRELPRGVRHFEFAPLSQVLPRSAALVHHGGVGTSSQALAAGAPQLVMPMTHDQPDNAARLVRLGVAETLSPRRFRGPAVARALERLTTSPGVARACRAAAARLERADGIGLACEAIEAELRAASTIGAAQ
jgi:UDP:flavonoid glycosyltransferase YjiC (YdhE family)